MSGAREPPSKDRGGGISRAVLMGDAGALRYGRRLLARIPSQPRCKLCGAPFHGIGRPFMRALGKSPWPKNPKYCGSCFRELAAHHDGAEIACSLLFADVRGSTRLAETMPPAAFRERMDQFFQAAAQVLIEHDAVVDKFVGDEVIGIFIPALTGELHARRAVDAGSALLAATARGHNGLPVGAGVSTGIAFVGAVGAGDNVELTAMGDIVNVAARLASAAGAGELLVTAAAAEAARIPGERLEHRTLELKGKSSAIEVLVLGPAAFPISR